MEYENLLTDRDIRLALHSALKKMHGDQAEPAFIEELGICQGRARIDIAVVNGVFHGYEIKSDRDSLRRLPRQVDMYSKVVDKATLVVGCRHLEESLELAPNWWGVIQVESGASGVTFKTMRQGHVNPSIDARSLVELLWRDQAIELLDQRGIAYGVRSKPRGMIWDRICERLEVAEIASAVRKRLMDRVMTQGLPTL